MRESASPVRFTERAAATVAERAGVALGPGAGLLVAERTQPFRAEGTWYPAPVRRLSDGNSPEDARRAAPQPRKSTSLRFLRAFALALLDRATYDLRSNPGLWLGFAFAIPIPILVASSGAPRWMIAASLAAPLCWSAVVGAAVRVGLLGAKEIQELTVDARDRDRVHKEECAGLRDAVEIERDEHVRLARLQRLAAEELALGQEIQRSLVPSGIRRDDVEIAVRHIPCMHVGGDYLQASLPRPDLLYLCVGDVAGHGVAAALAVSRIHALVQSMIQAGTRPAPFLESLDRATLRLFERTALFMTFAVLRIDLSRRRIEYATAGHPPQWLLRAGGDVEELATPSTALGLQPTTSGGGRPAGSVTYAPGDTLLLFTDGLFETRAPDGEIWGQERLRSLFLDHSHSTPEVAVDKILGGANGFRDARTLDDDVSLMVARLGPRRPHSSRRVGAEHRTSAAPVP